MKTMKELNMSEMNLVNGGTAETGKAVQKPVDAVLNPEKDQPIIPGTFGIRV